MQLIFRWLMRIAVGLSVIAGLALLVVYFFAARSLPDYSRTIDVSGLDQRVEIVRDNANVPHIFSSEDEGVFFGLGFAHAQDRLWQMHMFRRTAQGRLSELFGRETLEIDTFMRRLDLYRLAALSYEHQDAATKSALTAYAAGVNARLNQINTEALGRGTPEMFLFNAPVAPWTPTDSIAVIKLMGVQLSGHLEEEVLRARVSLALPDPDRLKDILPDVPGAGIAEVPRYSELVPMPATQIASAAAPRHPLDPRPQRGFAGASNAWAAAPERSASGGTLLANDPHLGFTAPSNWYLARLELSSGGVIGATIPGLPLVLSGRSKHIAWGLTSAYVDDQDLYIEELNPENPEEYRTPTGWANFQTRPSIVRIKGSQPVTLKLRWSENGPILPPSQFSLKTITPPGHVVALSWTLLTEKNTSLMAGLEIMRARTVDEAIAAAENYVAPAQNLTLADQTQIALKTIGHIPKRDARHQSQGRIPSPGWLAANRWQGVMPYTTNPEFITPSSGILGNTNNKIVDRPFPNHVSFVWGDAQRVLRWKGLMQSRQVHTRDSFIEAQLDTVSYTARALLPLIGADLWFTGEAAPDGTLLHKRQFALALLASWNGEMNEHLPEPLIYASWLRALQTRLIRDELGPLAEEFIHVDPLFIERVFRNIDGAAAWCDVIQSSPKESCADMAELAIDDAILWIEEHYSGTIETLRWGDAHQATHDHPVLGTIPGLSLVANIRQSTSGGDNTLMRGRTKGSTPNPFFNVHGAGYRGVYDMADPDSSVFIISTGQSGHMLSRHYDDLAQLWRRGEYIPMSLDRELARGAAVGITRLNPAP